MRMMGASRAAGMVQGCGDGINIFMARERRACRCATRTTGRATGWEIARERRLAPPRQLGASSRRRMVAAPCLTAATKSLETCRTSIPPKKCEHRKKIHLDKACNLYKRRPH